MLNGPVYPSAASYTVYVTASACGIGLESMNRSRSDTNANGRSLGKAATSIEASAGSHDVILKSGSFRDAKRRDLSRSRVR